MEAHSELRSMIEEGKDRLEWYRQVDPAKLNTLKELMTGDDYKENMSTLIKTIYEFAFLTYSGRTMALSFPLPYCEHLLTDLPRGPIKNNSMRKLAAKTLLEILPENISNLVHNKMEEQGASPEFLTLVGMVSYYTDSKA